MTGRSMGLARILSLDRFDLDYVPRGTDMSSQEELAKDTLNSCDDNDITDSRPPIPQNDGAPAAAKKVQGPGPIGELPYWLREEKVAWRRTIQNFTPSWVRGLRYIGILS
jgi:hypothetical protein